MCCSQFLARPAATCQFSKTDKVRVCDRIQPLMKKKKCHFRLSVFAKKALFVVFDLYIVDIDCTIFKG